MPKKTQNIDEQGFVNEYLKYENGYQSLAYKYKIGRTRAMNILKKYSIKILSGIEIKRIMFGKGIGKWNRAKIVKCRYCGQGFKFYKGKREVFCDLKCRSLDEDNKQVIRDATIRQITDGKMPQAYTRIEMQIKGFLDKERIRYEYQYPFGYWVYDFKIGNVFVEVDGDYWHGNPKFYKELNAMQKNSIKRGKQKDVYAENRGFRVIRFWGDDIRNDFGSVKNAIRSNT